MFKVIQFYLIPEIFRGTRSKTDTGVKLILLITYYCMDENDQF